MRHAIVYEFSGGEFAIYTYNLYLHLYLQFILTIYTYNLYLHLYLQLLSFIQTRFKPLFEDDASYSIMFKFFPIEYLLGHSRETEINNIIEYKLGNHSGLKFHAKIQINQVVAFIAVYQ